MTEGFYKTDTYKTSNDDTWTTPRAFFDKLDDEFLFGLDAAALSSSTLVPANWYGPDHQDPERRDAFTRSWVSDSAGKPIYLNPPYGKTIGSWMGKANAEALSGAVVVCLVPARTDTNWWHSYCIQHEVRFIKGRLKFGDQKNSAPFPSAVVIMK
jgi:phage N-6-adenine-methyltransferase